MFKSRILLVVSAFALASSALAAPKVGDSVSFDGTLVGDGINTTVKAGQKITAFNGNTNVFTVLYSQTIGSQSQSKEENVSGDDIVSEETATMVVELCEAQGFGKKEHVKVPGGEFDTCRIVTSDGSTLWVASVPFGIVKMQSKVSLGMVNLGMSSFSRGQ